MDDVNYLKRRGTEESFLFVVDSSKRDTAVYNEPNEYEVKFNAPFKCVVGLDLVDATVPRTEYLVEAGRNQLVYAVDGGQRQRATVQPGDYNIQQLIAALNAMLGPELRVAAVSSPAELTNRVRFVGAVPFAIYGAESSIQQSLGLGLHTLTSSVNKGVLGARTALTGPLPGDVTVNLTSPVRQQFVAPGSGSLTQVSAYVASSQGDQVRVAVVRNGQLLAHGSATLGEATIYTQVVIPLESLASVSQGQLCHVIIDSSSGASSVFCSGLGVSLAQGSPAGAAWWDYAVWLAGPNGDQVCVDVEMVVDGHSVDCPWVVNLTGEPYVLVRCADIEQYLYGERAFERVHPGLGIVKLGNYGFREQRYDFVSFPPRRLTNVISKVAKLTLRLEKASGELYDTKGINHHLVLVITTLRVREDPNDDKIPSTLNPHYTPNMLEHMQRVHVAQTRGLPDTPGNTLVGTTRRERW